MTALGRTEKFEYLQSDGCFTSNTVEKLGFPESVIFSRIILHPGAQASDG